jgi:cystathionine beta-lyase
MVYVETPSNPLLKITDLKMIGEFAKVNGLVSLIDNTFASPIIQVPDDFGIDVVIHSATKYMGGHSDISAGAVAASKEHIKQLWDLAINFGGNLSDMTVWLLERSMKTMALRVNAQCDNAMAMALYLNDHPLVEKVYYPGLESHPDHKLAKRQMNKFGAIVSFELNSTIKASAFFDALQLIKPSLSLAGVESTMLAPSKTSHSLLSPQERIDAGIADELIRFSLGIEEVGDLIQDIEQAFEQIH